MKLVRAVQIAAISSTLGFWLPAQSMASFDADNHSDSGKQFKVMENEESWRERRFSEWKTQEREETYLVIALGLLGIIITASQGTSNVWVKRAVAVLGISVSAITLVIDTNYPADYKTLRRAVRDEEPRVQEMKNELSLYDKSLSPSGFQDLQTKFYISANKFDSISHGVLGIDKNEETDLQKAKTTDAVNTSLDSLFLSVAYAQKKPNIPSWILSAETSNADGVFIVGTATSPSLDMASVMSFDDAANKAVDVYQKGHPDKAAEYYKNQLRSLVRQLGFASDTWIDREPSGLYIYYTRFYLSNKINNIALIPPPAAVEMHVLSPEPWDAQSVKDKLGVHIRDNYYCYRFILQNLTGHDVTLLSAEVEFAGNKTLRGDSGAEIYAKAARFATKAHKKMIDSLIISEAKDTSAQISQARAVFVRKALFKSLDPRSFQSIRIRYLQSGEQLFIELRP